jgi:hypothetical protein
MSAFLVTASAATGQGLDTGRPVQAVFGAVDSAPGARQTMGISLSGLSVYEDNNFHERSSSEPLSIYDSNGVHYSGDAAANYAWRGAKRQVAVNAGSSLSYYPTYGELVSTARYASAGIDGEVGRRARIFANQSAICSPARLQGIFPIFQGPTPGALPMFGQGLELDDLNSCAYESDGLFTYGLGRRSTIDFTGSARYTSFDTPGYDALQAYSAGGHFMRSLSRTMQLRLGYTHQIGEYLAPNGSSKSATTHNLDIGVDYQRPISLSRRTRLTFSSGSTIVDREAPAGSTVTTGRKRQFGVTATIGLSHEFGRTWRTEGIYTRGVSFVDGFAGPVFGDGVTVSLGGLFSRRLDFNASGGLSFGNLDGGYGGQNFSTYLGTTRLRYGLTRMWAVFGEYTFLYSDLGSQPLALYGSADPLRRNAVRAGLTLWLPVLKH